MTNPIENGASGWTAEQQQQLKRLVSELHYSPADAAKLVRSGNAAVLLARSPAQKSESAPAPKCGPRYFVCRECLASFVGDPGAPEVRCPCGAARFGDDGTQPFSEMGIPHCSPACLEVTELVELGKLSAVLPTPAQEQFPHLCVLAWHNRTTRNVEQELGVPIKVEPTAEQRIQIGQSAVGKGVIPATDYLMRASAAGARVDWHARYHTRKCGTQRDESGVEYLKHEHTGCARFFGQVIARREENEADGSLIFAPVDCCARCGGNHAKPLAYWKLTHPVVYAPGVAPPVVIATHFAMCPTTGEPVYMACSDTTEDNLPVDFTVPHPTGEQERTMNTIDGPGSIGSAPATSPMAKLGGVKPESSAYQQGYEAAGEGATIFTNPFAADSKDSDEWRRGFMQWKDDKDGN